MASSIDKSHFTPTSLKGATPQGKRDPKLPSLVAKTPVNNSSPPALSEQALNLKATEASSAKEKAPMPDSEAQEKAHSVAETLVKAPTLPISLPASTKPLKEKKADPPPHFIKKPAVIFIEGFSAFGISNGDGIADMAENFPGAKKFSWTDHDEIMSEIKKHAPSEPVVLVGHSFGGDTAIEVAHELNSAKNGFRAVDLLVSIDAVGMNKTIIPINVKSNLNFFGEGLVPFIHGDPTVARNTKYTEVTNELRSDLHSKMEDSPEVQFQIFEKINQVIGGKKDDSIFIEISETNTIKDLLEAMKDNA